MVKPAAHDSFYKCSIHFSLILINYNFFLFLLINIILFSLVRVLKMVDRLNLKLSDENRVRSSRSSDNEKY
jgi:hypothetical protein